jgi:hypothetical protein
VTQSPQSATLSGFFFLAMAHCQLGQGFANSSE